MSDKVLNIKVTERELDLIMELLHEAGIDRVDDNGQPAIELCHDLMEQSGFPVDDFGAIVLDDDLTGRTFEIAEDHFIDAGIQAREQMKATSMAANRRTMRFGEFNVEAIDERTDQQRVDVWERPNDPTKW